MSVQPDNQSRTLVGADFDGPEMEAYTLIRQINSMMETYNRYDLRSEDLTVPQFMILSYATPSGVALSEISAHMLCDNSNLTGIVDRLIAKGYITSITRLIFLLPLELLGPLLLNIQRRHRVQGSVKIAHLGVNRAERPATFLLDQLCAKALRPPVGHQPAIPGHSP